MSCIQKFRLYLTSFDFKLASHMSLWVSAAINKNVKELEIHAQTKKKRVYSLPQTIFTAGTITSLKLYGCKLENCTSIKLSNLQELSIKNVRVDVDTIQSFICGCPLMKDLRLIHCGGLECLHISALPKLSRVEIHECPRLKCVEIEAPYLQTFWYHGKRGMKCNINLVGCKNIRSLTLKDTSMTDELFQDQISKFPVLEKLVLQECNSLERITILSERIRRLALLRCKKLVEALIDASNLLTFEYTGDKLPFSFMNISSLHEVKLYFAHIKKDKAQLFSLEMQKFLGKFDQSKGFKLVTCSNKDVTIHEELREIQLPLFYDLKIELTKSVAKLKDLVNISLMCQPYTLSIVSSPGGDLLQSIDEKIMKREKNPSCCRYYSRKCFRHFLEDVQIDETQDPTFTYKLKWDPCG